jgi:hypothetical protein
MKRGVYEISEEDLIKPGDELPAYTILKKAVRPIKWNRLFLALSIGFASVWLIYAIIRWVVIAFIVGGFKHKT